MGCVGNLIGAPDIYYSTMGGQVCPGDGFLTNTTNTAEGAAMPLLEGGQRLGNRQVSIGVMEVWLTNLVVYNI